MSHIEIDRVHIAEDHNMYQDGLELLIRSMFDNIEVSRSVDFPGTLSALDKETSTDLLLLDIKMPGTKDLDGLREIRSRYPMLTIIVISTLDFEYSIRRILDLGANGFIAKSSPKREMVSAIRSILLGEIFVLSEKDHYSPVELSSRQIETLKYMAKGWANKEIAIKMGISPATAKEYVSKVIERLGAENRTQAVLLAQQYGLLLDCLP